MKHAYRILDPATGLPTENPSYSGVPSARAVSEIAGPVGVVAAVATGSGLLHEAEKLMEAHVQRIYRGNLPQAPREGWTLRDHDYDHAVRWWRGDGWWTIEHAMLWPSREMAEAYAAGFRGWRPTVEFARHQNAKAQTRAEDQL